MVPGLEQRDPLLYRELERLVRRYRWRQVAKAFDELTTRGRVRSIFRRTRGLQEQS